MNVGEDNVKPNCRTVENISPSLAIGECFLCGYIQDKCGQPYLMLDIWSWMYLTKSNLNSEDIMIYRPRPIISYLAIDRKVK